jgi:hypothetical protein
MALLASDDLDEVKSLSREFVPFQPPSLGFEAFDYSAINVLDPSFIKQAKTILIDSAIAEAASERNRFEEIKRERALTQEEQADFNEATNAFNNSKEEGSQETILGTPFGLAAFVRFVSVDNKFSKIPDARNYFPQFYDEDGKFIGIPDQ